MIQLQNDCSYSGLNVFPQNWNSAGASLKEKWYIYYRFYSTDCKKGKLKIIKGGINALKTLSERRDAVRALLKAEKSLLEERGYNPVQNRLLVQRDDYIISPDTGFIEALNAAFKRLDYEHSTMSDLRSIISGTSKAAALLNLTSLEI